MGMCNLLTQCHTLMQILPDSFRGAILGLSSLAPDRKRAIYVTFGSGSLGIPSALSRVFTKVKHSNVKATY